MRDDGRLQRYRSRYRMTFLFLSALVLLVPVVAMSFTREVNWGLEDVGAAAALLGAGWLSVELGVRFTRNGRGRLLLSGLAALAVAVLWAHLAVGI